MAANSFPPPLNPQAIVVNLADYRAGRAGAPRAAQPARVPPVKRLPSPRDVAHRRRMLRHLASRA